MEKPAPAPPAKTRTKKSEKGKVKKHADKVAMAEGDSSLHSTGDDSNSRISVPSSGEVSKIKLPTSDTPIQRKNQQFRKGPGGERRRSSLGRRGRRASSMMQEGIIGMGTTKCPNLEVESKSDIAFFVLAAEPHSEISHKEFYKHIDEEQMENARMKQLLSWCGKRELDKLQKAAPPGSSSSDVEGSARHVARMMAEDLLKEITTNGELSTWFTRADSPAPAPIKKPNPRNTQNQTEQERLKAHLEVLNNEHESWQSLLSLKPNVSLDRPNNSPDFLRPEETAFKASQAERQDIITQARRLVKHQGTEIEFSMDRLADGVHKLRAYGDAADELAGKVLETAGDALEEEDTRLRKSTGTDALSLQEVLRSISYANPSSSGTA
ncbi:Mtw1 kinetochore complex [Wilcoxina mikolae CBS 423.85]|nr:Mtw1 kinetochore complex [Wilcoxina mikolae CBS 423.85]